MAALFHLLLATASRYLLFVRRITTGMTGLFVISAAVLTFFLFGNLLVLGVYFWQYVAYLLVWALVPAYRVASLAYPLSHYVRLNTDDLVPGPAIGIALVIIAAVYQRGVELSREAELVI